MWCLGSCNPPSGRDGGPKARGPGRCRRSSGKHRGGTPPRGSAAVGRGPAWAPAVRLSAFLCSPPRHGARSSLARRGPSGLEGKEKSCFPPSTSYNPFLPPPTPFLPAGAPCLVVIPGLGPPCVPGDRGAWPCVWRGVPVLLPFLGSFRRRVDGRSTPQSRPGPLHQGVHFLPLPWAPHASRHPKAKPSSQPDGWPVPLFIPSPCPRTPPQWMCPGMFGLVPHISSSVALPSCFTRSHRRTGVVGKAASRGKVRHQNGWLLGTKERAGGNDGTGT